MRSAHTHEQAVANAAHQAGTISRKQLLMLGWRPAMIRSQFNALRWSELHEGIYLTHTGEVPIEAWWWAAHLLGGDQSAIAGESALQRWEIRTPSLPVTIEVPHTKQRTRDARSSGDLIVVRRRVLRPTRMRGGLPPTVELPEAIIDACGELTSRTQVANLITTACRSRRTTAPLLRLALTKRVYARNREQIDSVLTEIEGGSDSVLEIDAVRDVLRAHGLPEGRGQVQETVRGAHVRRDRVIEEFGLVLEFDGLLGHFGYGDRLRDHRRDNAVTASGRHHLRFGWEDIHESPCQSAAQIAAVLIHRGWTGCPNTCGSNCNLYS